MASEFEDTLALIRRLSGDATEGPWFADDGEYAGFIACEDPDKATLFRPGVANEKAFADAAFIVELANAWPEINAALRRLAEIESKLAPLVAKLHHSIEHGFTAYSVKVTEAGVESKETWCKSKNGDISVRIDIAQAALELFPSTEGW